MEHQTIERRQRQDGTARLDSRENEATDGADVEKCVEDDDG